MRRDQPLQHDLSTSTASLRSNMCWCHPAGGGFHGTADESLAALGRSRRVTVFLNSFLLVTAVIAESELVATVSARLARAWAQHLDVLAPPCEIASFTVTMGWHARAHADPAQVR